MNPNARPGAPMSGPNQMPNGAAQNFEQPVAYDQQGRPLYAHPPQQQQDQTMYLARPYNPPEEQVPPEIAAKAEESRKKYPNLNLSEGEYVLAAVGRHPIGLIQIWGVIAVLMLVFGAAYAFLFANPDSSSILSSVQNIHQLQLLGGVMLGFFFLLFCLGGMIATYVYNNNKFYLTNESVIQEIQTSLFSKHEQTASLGSIEDASYTQTGIIPMFLDYGVIRLSTPGDETTYTFTYVSHPKEHIANLNNAVEDFKNGRPVKAITSMGNHN